MVKLSRPPADDDIERVVIYLSRKKYNQLRAKLLLEGNGDGASEWFRQKVDEKIGAED